MLRSFCVDFAPLIIMLGLLYPVSSMISYLCKEKELRQKELMKMMSVTESDIGGSWFCTFMIVNFISATLAAFITSALFVKADGFLIWVFWMLTMIAVTTFCMAIASLSSKSIRGVLVGILTTFGGVFLTLALDATTANSGLTQLVSLLPVTAFSYGITQIGLLEDNGIGLTPDSINFSESKSGYSFGNTISILIFDCILWGVVSWYLNRVIKPDYGQALPLHFPFTAKFWCPGRVHAPVSNMSVSEKVSLTGIPYEQVSDTLKRQADEDKSIEIHDLRKTFGDKSAVDGLNLSMYSGQITALLGHNGVFLHGGFDFSAFFAMFVATHSSRYPTFFVSVTSFQARVKLLRSIC
jgi:ATP-binding cassette, subfamily A (ABC1), member 3